jgi:hypothetical protein
MNNIVIFKQSYGEFTTEKDGRLSGQVMTITGKRKDGKYLGIFLGISLTFLIGVKNG